MFIEIRMDRGRIFLYNKKRKEETDVLSYLNTAKEIRESRQSMAILPVGSIEQHGSHLPVGTDYLIVSELSRRVAERTGAYLLPALPISTCYEHKGTKGTVWMKPDTFYKMLQDIILSLKSQGFDRIVVLLGHGGIFTAGPAIRELNAMHDDLQVIKIESVNNEKTKAILEGDNGIHAGEKETSLILSLQEELVNRELMMQNDFVPDCPREFLNYAPLPVLSKTGVWGKPSMATKEKGDQLFEAMTDSCVEYINKAFQYTKREAW